MTNIKNKWDNYYTKNYYTAERYEYKCPYCGYINVRYDSTRRVVCDKCKKEFYTF